MKKTIGYFVAAIVLSIFVLVPARSGLAGNDKIFLQEIEKAADQAIKAWIEGDAMKLKDALERLVLNETYLMTIGRSNKKRSYLTNVPKSASNNFNAVAAYLFIIRNERKGNNLWPVSFFEGKKFEFEQMEAR